METIPPITPPNTSEFLASHFVQPHDDRQVLVIGGAGYIGSVLVRHLLQSGFRVRVLDSFLFGSESLLAIRANPELEILQGDLRSAATLALALRNVSDVIHLGGLVGDPACSLDTRMTLQVNLAATKTIRDVCAAHDVQRLIFASTCAVYGSASETCSEQSVTKPLSLYASTKLKSENILLGGGKHARFQPVILRLATVFGPSHRPRFDLVVNRLAAQAWFEGRITVFNRAQCRPFMHVEDVARAVGLILEAPVDRVGGEIFNVGDDALNCPLREVGRLIAVNIPGVVVQEVCQADDPRTYKVNFAKLTNELGFRSRHDVAAGIRQLCSLFENEQITEWQDARFNNELSLKNRRLPLLEGDLPLLSPIVPCPA